MVKDSLPLCGMCLKQSPHFDRTVACLDYTSPVSQWVYQLKFHHQIKFAAVLSDLLIEKIKATYQNDKSLPDCIIPVPLHPKRIRQRGYNQAALLAKPLSHALSLPMDKSQVKRTRYTLAQSQLRKKARLDNLKQAFSCQKPLPYRHVAIVDDVMTTGSTMNALAHCLKQHGVNQVDAWVAARAQID